MAALSMAKSTLQDVHANLPHMAESPAHMVLDRLQKPHKMGKGWQAHCPAHHDNSPSLSIAEGEDGRLLLHCFAGCEYRDIMAAIGLEPKDGFIEQQSPVARLEYRRQSIIKARNLENLVLNAGGNADSLSDEDVHRIALAHRRIKETEAELSNIDQQISQHTGQPGWQHPLTRVVELSDKPKPPVWLLPHFIAEGVVIIAGAHGVGKTTVLLPLAMAVAGLHEPGYPLAPREWRHVVYITEDKSQVERIIAGYAPCIGRTPGKVCERLHIVEATRMPTDAVVMAAPWYRENYSRIVSTSIGNTVELLPLVVFDTKAAVFEEANENDNAEASRMIAAIKQRFAGMPTWIIGHVSKGDLSRDGAKSGVPTLRGASAFEGDANQTLFLVKEKDETRWLVRGKTRFEAKWDELLITTYSTSTVALNVFEEPEDLTLRWAIASPQKKTRQEISAEATEEAKRKQEADKKLEMIDLINKACAEGEPLNRTGLAQEVGGNTKATKDLIRTIIELGWAMEVTVPPELRTHPKRNKFLVGLNNGERKQYLKDGSIPPEKLEIPDTWKKQPKTSKAAQADADNQLEGRP
tara:strand:+ start:3440 stop:5179 length:1740 start_codon:yes stop_codon:yes gene_type:complete